MSRVDQITLSPTPAGWRPDPSSSAPRWIQEQSVRLSETAAFHYALALRVEHRFIALEVESIADVLDARATAIVREWSE